jgi:hypothetical protein
MRLLLIAAAAGGLAALSACSDDAQDRAEDQLENQAEASAAQAGSATAALGLTERQLLDADLIDGSGADLGDVEAVLRNAGGEVDRLIVEVDGPDPDRYVEVPVQGLTTRVQGDDTDLVSTMAAADLEALPAATLPPAASPSPAQ